MLYVVVSEPAMLYVFVQFYSFSKVWIISVSKPATERFWCTAVMRDWRSSIPHILEWLLHLCTADWCIGPTELNKREDLLNVRLFASLECVFCHSSSVLPVKLLIAVLLTLAEIARKCRCIWTWTCVEMTILSTDPPGRLKSTWTWFQAVSQTSSYNLITGSIAGDWIPRIGRRWSAVGQGIPLLRRSARHGKQWKPWRWGRSRGLPLKMASKIRGNGCIDVVLTCWDGSFYPPGN